MLDSICPYCSKLSILTKTTNIKTKLLSRSDAVNTEIPSTSLLKRNMKDHFLSREIYSEITLTSFSFAYIIDISQRCVE